MGMSCYHAAHLILWEEKLFSEDIDDQNKPDSRDSEILEISEALLEIQESKDIEFRYWVGWN